MGWTVTALGEDGGEYVYSVDAPKFAKPTDVACCAYAQHGILYYDFQTLDELLTPLWRAEWTDDVTASDDANV